MRRTAKRHLYFLLGSLLTGSIIIGCVGVKGSEPGAVVASDRTVRSLRLGQTDTTDSPIAISAAIDTRESFVVLDSDFTSGGIEQVIYRSGLGDVASIIVSAEGLPLSTQTETAEVSFSNYTETTVLVTIASQGVVVGSQTIALQSDVQNLIQSGSSAFTARLRREAPTDESRRSILRAAIIAIRTFGCAGVSIGETVNVDTQFMQLAEDSCGSVLVSTVRDIVEDEEQPLDELIVSEPVVDDTGDCEMSMTGDFSGALDCISDVGGELVTQVLLETPLVSSVVDDRVETDAELAGEEPELFDPTNTDPLPEPTEEPPPDIEPEPEPTASPSPSPTPPEEVPDPPDPTDPVPDMP